MTFSKSKREKNLWFCVLLVILGIFSSLFLGRPLLDLFGNQNVQAALFLLGMVLTAGLVAYDGLKSEAGYTLISLYLGLLVVYIMLFLRLGLPERSHLIEYSVLAIFLFQALSERFKTSFKPIKIALFAAVIGCLIGIIDECLQLFIPDRVFDTNDIIFNCFAVIGAIGASCFLQWIKTKKKNH